MTPASGVTVILLPSNRALSSVTSSATAAPSPPTKIVGTMCCTLSWLIIDADQLGDEVAIELQPELDGVALEDIAIIAQEPECVLLLGLERQRQLAQLALRNADALGALRRPG